MLDKNKLINHLENLYILYNGDLVISDLIDRIKNGQFDIPTTE